MIELCLVGTGGMMPLTYRFLTSLYVRSGGKCLLIDCGEGTQVAIKKAKLSTNPIDYILFTHYHADHISGLIGLLLSMGNSDRVEPVTLVGPKGLQHIVESMRVIAPELPFKLNFIEIQDDYETFDLAPFRIETFKLKHKVLCYGYNVLLDRAPLFMKEKAEKNNVPLKYWNKLQHGVVQIDENNGITYTPDMVLGSDRKGLKLTYLTDTRPCENILKYCNNADLFICEGMYGDEEKLENAKSYQHMMMREACNIACKTHPKEMWLTHYSPSESKPIQYEDAMKEIFSQVHIVKDGTSIILNFENE